MWVRCPGPTLAVGGTEDRQQEELPSKELPASSEMAMPGSGWKVSGLCVCMWPWIRSGQRKWEVEHWVLDVNETKAYPCGIGSEDRVACLECGFPRLASSPLSPKNLEESS